MTVFLFLQGGAGNFFDIFLKKNPVMFADKKNCCTFALATRVNAQM